MKRRHFLKAAPAALAASAIPVAAMATETPVMALYREWKAALGAWEGAESLTEAESDTCCVDVYELADKVLDQPSAGPLDFVYKLMAQSFHGDHDIGSCPRGDELWAEARALVA